MADSFQQRISLEGAEDIIKNLQQIGSEATKAIGQLKTAVTSANPALAALSQTSLAAQNAMKGFGEAVRGATTLIAPFSGAVGGLLATFSAFAGPAGILAAVGGLSLFIKNAADSAIAIDRQSRALGLSIEQFKALKTVVAQSGISADELVTGLTRIAAKVNEVAQGQIKAAGELAKQIQGGLVKGFAPTRPTGFTSLEDIEKLKAAISSAIPILQEFFREAGDARFDIQNADQFAQKLFQAARGSDAASTALRKQINEITNMSTATTAADKLVEVVEKRTGGIEKLGVSFLDAKGDVLGLFESTLKLSDALSKLPEGPARTAAALKAAGRGIGPELFQALVNGRGEAERLVAELKKAGIDTSVIEAARALNKQMIDLEKNAKAAQQSLLLTIGPTITSELENLNSDLKKLKDPQAIVFSIETPAGGFNLTFNEIKRSATDLVNFLQQKFNLGNLFPQTPLGLFNITFNGLKQSAISLVDEISSAFQSLRGRVGPAITDLVAAIKQEFSGFNISAILEGIVQGFAELPGRISALFGTIDWSSALQTMVDAFSAAVDTIVGLWQSVIDKIREVFTLSAQAGNVPALSDTGDVSGGQARGGYIWGPGTGTSDSILARLSRGEFVIRAAAVSHYGPQLMQALNSMRLPRLPGFALGGLAEGLGRTLRANLAIPGLATGGAIPAPARAATVPITLDLRTDRGHFRGSAMADRDVAEALSRFAVIDQITSMGKKSGAY